MKSIERMPVVEQVTARLKEYIQSDERQVGEKLPTERELCDDLNVGRSTAGSRPYFAGQRVCGEPAGQGRFHCQ